MPRHFPKGVSPNPGGVRKDGKPRLKPGEGVKKQRLKVKEILDSLDFRPFEEMVNLYRAETTKARVKVDILTELCGYIAPKLKSIEMTGDNDNPFVINLNLQPGKKRMEFNQVIEEEIDDDSDDKKG